MRDKAGGDLVIGEDEISSSGEIYGYPEIDGPPVSIRATELNEDMIGRCLDLWPSSEALPGGQRPVSKQRGIPQDSARAGRINFHEALSAVAARHGMVYTVSEAGNRLGAWAARKWERLATWETMDAVASGQVKKDSLFVSQSLVWTLSLHASNTVCDAFDAGHGAHVLSEPLELRDPTITVVEPYVLVIGQRASDTVAMVYEIKRRAGKYELKSLSDTVLLSPPGSQEGSRPTIGLLTDRLLVALESRMWQMVYEDQMIPEETMRLEDGLVFGSSAIQWDVGQPAMVVRGSRNERQAKLLFFEQAKSGDAGNSGLEIDLEKVVPDRGEFALTATSSHLVACTNKSGEPIRLWRLGRGDIEFGKWRELTFLPGTDDATVEEFVTLNVGNREQLGVSIKRENMQECVSVSPSDGKVDIAELKPYAENHTDIVWTGGCAHWIDLTKGRSCSIEGVQ